MNFLTHSKALVELFYPLVEVSLFDEKGCLIEILNPFSHLKQDQEKGGSPKPFDQSFMEDLVSGQKTRTLWLMEQESGNSIRFRFALSSFIALNQQLQSLLQIQGDSSFVNESESWKGTIDKEISHYLDKQKLSLMAASAKEKREIISLLQKQGLLDIKESSIYVAAKLGISRATLYNYLKTAKSLKKIRVHQVDAFTNEQFGGNPAGVVLEADGLDESTMRKITRELNLSETAFIQKSSKGDFQMRYFTPTGHELVFCGHSTVGALFMLAKERRFGMHLNTSKTFKVETKSGLLDMEATIEGDEEIQVAYQAPQIHMQETVITHDEIAKAIGFDSDWIDACSPILIEKTNQDLYLVIRSLDLLGKIECDPKSLTAFCKKHDLVAVCLFTTESFDQQNQFHVRCFAPKVGILEDPFTGSILGGLSATVDTLGLIPKGQKEFRVEQGHFVNRPGVVRVSYRKNKDQFEAKIYAEAVHCFSTEIHLT